MTWIKRSSLLRWIMVGLTLYTWAGCVAFMAVAQDQTVTVVSDDDVAMEQVYDVDCANLCTTVDCFESINEDLGSPDGEIMASSTYNVIGVFNWDTLTKNPSTSTDAQTINMLVSECDPACAEGSQVGSPSIYVYLFCNGSQQGTQIYGPEYVGGSEVDELHSFNWTFPGSGCQADGSDAQIGLNVSKAGGGKNQSHICYEAVEWDVTWAPAGRARRTMMVD